MRSAADALNWQLRQRNRVPALVLGGYLAVLSVFTHLPGAGHYLPTLCLASVPLGVGLLILLAGFTFPEADLAAPGSGYPKWMLVLPISTRELVLWPMLTGGVAAALGWILPVMLILMPLGVRPPLAWPAVMVAAALFVVQALIWSPMVLPYLRIVLAVVLVPALITLGTQAALAGVSEGALAAGFAVLAVAAYGLAVAGLSRARRGEMLTWRFPGIALFGRGGTGTAFASAERAQLWLEWREGGLAHPMITGALCVLLVLLPLVWMHETGPVELGTDVLEVNLWVRLFSTAFLLLPACAAVSGLGWQEGLRRRGEGLSPFTATRPLSEAAMVGAKFKAAALSTALSWLVALVTAAICLLVPARRGAETAPLALLLLRSAGPDTLAAALLVFVVLVFWTWKSQVETIWSGLAGNRLFAGVMVLATYGGTLLAVGPVFDWIGRQTEAPALWRLPVLLPWVLGSAALLKLGTIAWVAHRTRGQGLLEPSHLAVLLAMWLGAVLVLATGLVWTGAHLSQLSPLSRALVGCYLPFLRLDGPPALREPYYLVVLSTLFVPCARLLAAPLALQVGRHRR